MFFSYLYIYSSSTHRHYNVNRSYINIHSNTRLEFNYLFTILSFAGPYLGQIASGKWVPAPIRTCKIFRNHEKTRKNLCVQSKCSSKRTKLPLGNE